MTLLLRASCDAEGCSAVVDIAFGKHDPQPVSTAAWPGGVWEFCVDTEWLPLPEGWSFASRVGWSLGRPQPPDDALPVRCPAHRVETVGG